MMPKEILAREFVTLLDNRSGPARIRLRPEGRASCIPEWFRGAWSTFQRTTGQRGADKLTPSQQAQFRLEKRKMSDLLADFLETKPATPANFDQEWSSLLGQLQSTCTMRAITLGHAQKLASIFVKYAYSVHYGIGAGVAPGRRLIETCEQWLCVPVDRDVIGRMRLLSPQKFISLQPGGESLRQIDGRWVRWSGLDCEATYWRFQEVCRSEAQKRGETPLEFEMRHLWQQ